jgi:hypothetical protein
MSKCQKVIGVPKQNAHVTESSEVSVSTAPIPSTHVSNSSDDSSRISPVNSPESEVNIPSKPSYVSGKKFRAPPEQSQSDQLIPLQKKLPKWKREEVIDLVINRFKRTTSCLDLHASIDRDCMNQVDCYFIYDAQICPICKKDH